MNKFFIRKIATMEPPFSGKDARYDTLNKLVSSGRGDEAISVLNPRQSRVMTTQDVRLLQNYIKSKKGSTGKIHIPMNLTLPPEVAARLRGNGIPKQANTQTYNFQSPEDRKRFINKDNTSKGFSAFALGTGGGSIGLMGGMLAGMALGRDSLRIPMLGAGLGALAGGLYGALNTNKWNKKSQQENTNKWNKMTNNGRRSGSLTTTTNYYPVFM